MVRFVAALIVALLGGAIIAGPARSAECVEDRRTVQVAGGTTKLRAYRCQVGGETLVVEFHRMSSIAASIVLSGKSSQVLSPLFGGSQVIKNSVGKRFETILALAPNRKLGDSETRFDVSSPGQETSSIRVGESSKNPTYKHIFWSGATIDIVPPADEAAKAMKNTLPSGYNFTVESPNMPPSLWRYFRRSDFDNYEKNALHYSKVFRITKRDTAIYSTPPDDLDDFVKAVGGVIPENLIAMELYVSGSGCDEPREGTSNLILGTATLPEIIVETAVIRNTGKKPVTVESYLGTKLPGSGVRKYSNGDKAKLDDLPMKGQQIPPGKSLVVPLAITLAVSGKSPSGASKQLVAQTAKRLGASPKQHVVQSDKKVVVGEAYGLNGLRIGGDSLRLEGHSANYASIQNDLEGSCPYLATHSSADGWVERGKILHRAHSAAREETETYKYEGFIQRIKLEEREAERAQIRDINVVLHTVNRTVPASIRYTVNKLPMRALEINWGEGVELEIVLPEGIAESDVTMSEISFKGYYERYSALATNLLDGRSAAGTPTKLSSACPLPTETGAISQRQGNQPLLSRPPS